MQEKQEVEGRRAASPVAAGFVEARLSARALRAYPGALPQTLAQAYAIQDEAIRLWPDALAGWKVGRIIGEAERAFGCDRLAGPIFRDMLTRADGRCVDAPVFKDGFAAVEAECVLVLGQDAPPEKLDWTADEARALIGSVAVGVEIASSPFAEINDRGPLVTISDFGNNNGLILGDEISDWRDFAVDAWRFETLVGRELVGASSAAGIPGGPVESLRFLLENCAARGLPLKKGMTVSSGAVTGVHEAAIGQIATVRFNADAEIRCRLVAAEPPRRAGGTRGRKASA